MDSFIVDAALENLELTARDPVTEPFRRLAKWAGVDEDAFLDEARRLGAILPSKEIQRAKALLRDALRIVKYPPVPSPIVYRVPNSAGGWGSHLSAISIVMTAVLGHEVSFSGGAAQACFKVGLPSTGSQEAFVNRVYERKQHELERVKTEREAELQQILDLFPKKRSREDDDTDPEDAGADPTDE